MVPHVRLRIYCEREKRVGPSHRLFPLESLLLRLTHNCSPATASPSAWTAKGPGATTCSLSGCGAASNTRRFICGPTKPSARRDIRLAGISTFITDEDPIRVLTT